jgi:hypothetical protein
VEPVQHQPNGELDAHVGEAARVLALPLDVNNLRWHPFGLYSLPLASRTDAGGAIWSRRLHVWHPEAKPVGESSPYGVHTHSGTARSHVLVGTLRHHLYEFDADPAGNWQRAALSVPEGNARLTHHIHDHTTAGTTHTLPKDQAHGVTKEPGSFAISLFEQRGGEKEQDFTTWQRMDLKAEELLRAGPLPVIDIQKLALQAIDNLAIRP